MGLDRGKNIYLLRVEGVRETVLVERIYEATSNRIFNIDKFN